MTHSSANLDQAPGQDELIAFVDGRLDPPAHRRIELWLAANPDIAAVLDEHRLVMEAARATAAPEPTEADWAKTLARIEAALPAPRAGAPWSRRLQRVMVQAAAAAAAVLLLAMPGDRALKPAPGPATAHAVLPIPVASAEEVEIVSIEAADLWALVVGHPPLRGPLVLAVAGDVELHHAESGDAGWVPAMPDGEGDTPMIVMPMRTGPEEKP